MHDALMDFCVRWRDGFDTLTDDTGAISDTLSRATQAYRAVDDAATRSLTTDPGEGADNDG
ncbi:hypothetical protein [Amycolatopsis sp. NPDC050768]|uniref:hypothetical protein n=1 Tax=Amycolatopsis sp. NPDC050768 TaxID=3154839 RepID=UPI0033FE5252